MDLALHLWAKFYEGVAGLYLKIKLTRDYKRKVKEFEDYNKRASQSKPKTCKSCHTLMFEVHSAGLVRRTCRNTKCSLRGLIQH